MKIGMVGLGRMGANMTRRLLRAGHECVVFDVNPDAAKELTRGVPAGSLKELADRLEKPRAVWMMLPAAVVDSTLAALAPRLARDDVVVDGGNSHYQDAIRRSRELGERGIHYLDVGVSGGVWGLDLGYCQMIGGEEEIAKRLDPIFAALAPGFESAARTQGRQGEPGPAEHGYVYCGPAGAGHFVKMVHNGIEYGVMAAYAEGLNILQHANVGKKRPGAADAETTPLRNPEHYQYDLDLAAIAEVWRRGSVIRSWLLDLTAAALRESPDLSRFTGRVSDSGEGRWTLHAAIDEGVPAAVLNTALTERFASRGEWEFANKLLSALRYEFGGHEEKKG